MSVKLDRLPMPIVEFEDGQRQEIRRYEAEDIQGDIQINGCWYKRDGSPSLVAKHRIIAIHPPEPRQTALAWQNVAGTFKVAAAGEALYIVGGYHSIWAAWCHKGESTIVLGAGKTEDQAAQICEVHAAGSER